MTLTLEDARWLVEDDARAWLNRLADDERPLHQQAASLRGELSPTQTHLLLEQQELRRLGQAKFAAADAMFFTRVGLEQATDETIATYKAARMPEGEPLTDLCCGIGGDLIALAARGAITAVDLQPVLTILATANVAAAYGKAAAHVLVQAEEAANRHVADVAAWHIDPDRRRAQRRTTQVELHQPSPDVIDALRSANPHAAIKLAPATEPPAAWSAESEREWISRGRECRQQIAWFGDLAQQPGTRSATVLTAAAPPARFFGQPQTPLDIAAGTGRFVYEPDPAILAAHLTGALAAECRLQALAQDVVYLTSDNAIDHPALAAFEVTDVLPFRVRKVKRMLAARGIGRLEVKKRGVPHDPEQVRRQLQTAGDASATLLLTRLGDTVTAILAQRREPARQDFL